jgi:tRNA A-37 threonylcarbamoyl transferase component Bud32
MMLFIQRLRVCIRLFETLVYLLFRRILSVADTFNIQKRGNGLSSTFIVGQRVVIKIRNERASINNRKLYNGKFDGLFFYSDDAERLRNEFQFYDLFHRHGMTAKPLLLTNNALVTSYIDSDSLRELSPQRLSQFFDLMDRVHALNVFHGDFNLSNFLLQKENLFIVDFESSRYVSDGQRGDLYALDTIIFIEKLNRFHKDVFLKVAQSIRTEVEKREADHSRIRDFGKQYLPDDVYAAVFG